MFRAVALIFFVAMPAAAWGQPPAAGPGGAPREVLTLEQAFMPALEHNRLIKNEQLEVEKAEARVEIARTRRLLQLELDMLAFQAITPINFRFSRFSLGEIPGGGPFPVQGTKIRSSRAPDLLLFARATTGFRLTIDAR